MSSAEPLDSGTTRWAPAAVDVDQAFDADGLYALRATLSAHASELGAPEEQIEHLLIIAVELATNAIRHGGGGGRLRFWRSDGHLYCQVSDRGPGIADPSVGRTPPDPTRVDGGRGMWICRNLATEIVIDTGPGGRGATVTAAILLAAD
jgi:anti-sigma regulatory factor (Ser/Thr protein kinase)